MIKITPDSIKSIDRWIMEAKEFANQHSCVIYLEEYSNSQGDRMLIELCHTEDEKTKSNWRSSIHDSEYAIGIFRNLYNNLPFVRRIGGQVD